MYIEEVKDGDSEAGDLQLSADVSNGAVVVSETKRVLVGAGARALFYPTLLYNVLRNKIQTEFRWWDRVDEFILLGAVPFPADVMRLKELGVGGVVTLNEPYETLVPTTLYHANNIDHLVIPTRDYLFAPSYDDICKAVKFIHENASSGKTTYVHCKAGRGRSTTIVLCYLVKHKQMSPDAAYEYVRSIRPRVRLASSQWQAVQDYYLDNLHEDEDYEICPRNSVALGFPVKSNDAESFDDGSLVFVTESDLEGYEESYDSGHMGNTIFTELRLACRAQFVSQAAVARLSCLWFRCQAGQKVPSKDIVGTDQLGNVGVNIRVC